MSQSANHINDALKLYRAAQGTEAEQLAFDNLNAVVERVKRGDECCNGRCRWCPQWRGK